MSDDKKEAASTLLHDASKGIQPAPGANMSAMGIAAGWVARGEFRYFSIYCDKYFPRQVRLRATRGADHDGTTYASVDRFVSLDNSEQAFGDAVMRGEVISMLYEIETK